MSLGTSMSESRFQRPATHEATSANVGRGTKRRGALVAKTATAPEPSQLIPAHSRIDRGGPPRTIAVDLTRLLPGGVSGGVKVVSVELIQQLAEQAPRWNFLVLTSASSHEELAVLQRANVRRVCLDSAIGSPTQSWRARLRSTKHFRGALRHRYLSFARSVAWRYLWKPRRLRLLETEQVDALLLPLTTPTFYAHGVPTVAVVYDLQHVDHPEFFRRDERVARSMQLATLSKSAARLICISNHTRAAMQRCLAVSPEQTIAIPFGLRSEFPIDERAKAADTLQRHGLKARGFWFYPANSWPHKNHLRLFEAFAEYRRRHGRSSVKLVCCGADTGRHEVLRKAIARGHLEDAVKLIGYVSDDALLDLMVSCRGVVFPSLYEGFGMPVLEAMACGVPVACSNRTSLPEVVGDAAELFDPSRTESITAALERLDDPNHSATLAAAGRRRAASFDTVATMAQRYLKVLDDVCQTEDASLAPHLR